MSEASSVEEILAKAKEEEERYEWLKAADCYRKALTAVAETDSPRKGEISERLAYAVYKAAFQAENSNEFKERTTQAIVRYKEARTVYAESNEVRKAPRISRCDAMITFAGYWLAHEASEKKKLIDECWTLAKCAMDAFIGEKEDWECGRAYAQLSLSAFLKGLFEGEYAAGVQLESEAIQLGEQAITALQSSEDSWSLGKVYVQTAVFLEGLAVWTANPVEQEKYCKKAQSYALRARQTCEEASLLESHWVVGWDIGSDEAIALLNKELDYAAKAKDRFSLGWALAYLSIYTFNKRETVEDFEERAELLEKALDYAKKAKNEFNKLSWISPCVGLFWIESPYIRYFHSLASDETDLDKRRDLLKKAIESAPEGLKVAEESGCPIASQYVHGILSRALLSLAKTETISDKRKELLQKALEHISESTKILERAGTFGHFLGVELNYLADIKCQIADLTTDSGNREKALLEAIQYKGKAIGLIHEDLLGYRSDDKALYARLGGFQFEYGEMLERLYKQNGNRQHFAKAVEAFRQAGETFQKLGLVSRSAECWWKSAQAYDGLCEYSKAAENFELASKDYQIASDKIPKLRAFYEEHSLYMQAWMEIGKGRHHHQKQEYGMAEEHFGKAAEMHESSTRWSYLAPSYTAWSKLEHAEELSRKEQSEEAIKAFEEAAKLFGHTKESIRAELNKIEDSHEKTMVTGLAKASELRCEYCIGRITLEEARILDKKGDHSSSSEKYGGAAEKFDRIAKAVETDQEKKELGLITILSLAWQNMTQAEAETSPALYSEAAQLFEKAKELSSTEKAKMLALGHSRFCKALEAGAKFTDTRDMTEHSRAMQNLEIATSYYLKADFQSASEYTKATRFLFDAYVHMGNAARETDPEKKTRLYTLAQKLLQASADSYAKANNPSRREQALKLLETANEQRELAFSLAEVLHAPIMTSTIAFATPSPTSEKAAGLERFEHAEVNANLMLSRRELRVGETLDLEIELANAGKGQALLTQIERAVPEGFELAVKPELYRVEGFNINMKGRRLDPLKAEEVKFSLRPKHKGSFTMTPKILYLDENGNAKSHQPEPVTITVKELGIKGWITGDT
jgi:hypothetical protein